jgi:superfamily II DNA or RNA helicase
VPTGPKAKRAIQAAVENANLAIFDEAHFLACETIQAIFKASKRCRYMFGLSGTDWRDDGADLLLEASCGRRIFNMPASKLIELGYLVAPKIALVEVPPLDEPCPANWNAVYSKYITHNQVRNQLIIDGAKKLVGLGRKVLILVRYLPHGQKLVDMLDDVPVFFVNGGLESSVRQDAKERFEKGELRCLVASSVFDIGVDIPSLDALVLAGGGKSTVRVLQRIGRVIRACKGKTDALVMDFIDNARYLDKHSATRIAVYETEPNFQIKFPRGFDRDSLKRVKKVKVKVR